jgi:hypothetical protein
MHDVPFIDGPDVSPAMDGDCQLLPWSRRDAGEKKLAPNIFQPPGALIGQQMEIPEILDR